MARALAILMSVVVAFPGCALHGSNRLSHPLRLAEQAVAPQPAQDQGDDVEWARFLAELPVGSKVKVTTSDGRSFKAVFLGAGEEHVTVKPRTRVPEAVRRIPLASLGAVELDKGMSLAKLIGISAAVGGATVVGVFLILLAAIAE